MRFCAQCKEWDAAVTHQCYRDLYDPEDGTLTFFDRFVQSRVQVRAQLEEAALERAVVEELRRKGYTVTEP